MAFSSLLALYKLLIYNLSMTPEGKIINLKPIEGTDKKEFSSSEEARKELLQVLGMSENAKPEAVQNAVKYINEMHSKYMGFRTEEKFEAKKEEILGILLKLKFVKSLEEAQKIIDEDYNNDRKEHNAAFTLNMARGNQKIGTFLIDGKEYSLIKNFGGLEKLEISGRPQYPNN